MAVSFEQAGVPAGVIATGVDFTDIDDETFASLHKAFLDNHVLCIRGSEISQQQQLDFAARWGKVHQHPYVPHIEGYPGMMMIFQVHPITETWHADTTHALAPPKITTRPFSRWRIALRRMYGSATACITIADCTRVTTPQLSNASISAKEFITVASIPI